ncbi:MAG: D-alanyl-D-alanine carboxypeptidase/D-alanyl-D-alanine-endopeptidase [Bacteroidaceae bacterium]|nr:D-alanyl-D-alanine carboxypeptidase/D-alanyl-D-alanine-endopeptidase [Bacteroidaceae bacterium]
MKINVLLIWLLAFPLLAIAQEREGHALTVSLDSLIQKKLPKGGQVGVSVIDLSTDETLYDYQGDKLCRPASTQKLITAITALNQPQGKAPFRTEVWVKGVIANDTLQGDLYVVGGMDPELMETALDTLVDLTATFPFHVITGQVYGDVSMRDSLYWGKGWLWDDNPESYQPYLSPLMLNKGFVKIAAVPTTPGEPALLEVKPTSSYFNIINETKTKTSSAGKFSVMRDWMNNSNDITVSGNVSARRVDEINVYSSQDFFMHTFLDRLGMRFTLMQPWYNFAELQKNDSCQLVAEYETPVQKVLQQMMKESDNLNAEAMFTRLGVHSSGKNHVTAEEGVEAIKDVIKTMNLNPDDYRIADGCGLSMYDYISPDLLVAFLRYAYNNDQIFPLLFRSLPVAGMDGTLKNRMRKGSPAYQQVYAKTGSYTGISTLAGYLETNSKRYLAFAIMNQNQLKASEARALQDAICELLVKE